MNQLSKQPRDRAKRNMCCKPDFVSTIGVVAARHLLRAFSIDKAATLRNTSGLEKPQGFLDGSHISVTVRPTNRLILSGTCLDGTAASGIVTNELYALAPRKSKAYQLCLYGYSVFIIVRRTDRHFLPDVYVNGDAISGTVIELIIFQGSEESLGRPAFLK